MSDVNTWLAGKARDEAWWLGGLGITSTVSLQHHCILLNPYDIYNFATKYLLNSYDIYTSMASTAFLPDIYGIPMISTTLYDNYGLYQIFQSLLMCPKSGPVQVRAILCGPGPDPPCRVHKCSGPGPGPQRTGSRGSGPGSVRSWTWPPTWPKSSFSHF